MTNYFGNAIRLARQKAKTFPRRMDAAYPSDASVEIRIGEELQVHGACLRRQAYRITETPETEPESEDKRLVAEMGEVAHTVVAGFFAAAEQLVHEEVRIWIPEIKLSGRIDVAFRPEPNGRIIGCEVKSIAGYNGRRGVIEPNRNAPLYPQIKHLAQTVVYAEHCYEKLGITEWIILYICRETGLWREHQVIYNGHDNILVNGQPSSITPKAVYGRWKRLWEYIDQQQLPPRDYHLRYSQEDIARMAERGELNKEEKTRFNAGKKVDKGDKECREWCAWRTKCWKEDKDV